MGVQPGEVLTVSAQGMPSLRGGRRGDLRVVVNVVSRAVSTLSNASCSAAERHSHRGEPAFRGVRAREAPPRAAPPRHVIEAWRGGRLA